MKIAYLRIDVVYARWHLFMFALFNVKKTCMHMRAFHGVRAAEHGIDSDRNEVVLPSDSGMLKHRPCGQVRCSWVGESHHCVNLLCVCSQWIWWQGVR